jgi:uncharacterized protein (TIGR00251 family)
MKTRQAPEPTATLEVWVQPRASRDQVVGLQGDAVKVRVAAPPVDGEANAALLRYLAKALGVPRSRLEIVRGESGRRKTLKVTGLDDRRVWEHLGLSR